MYQFGGFTSHEVTFTVPDTIMWPNGAGKTTVINAYVFALSGKTLGGFKARNVYAKDDEPTKVVLITEAGTTIRRDLVHAGTVLYLNDNVITQSELNSKLNVDLAVACANVNVLTNPDLTSEQLRKLLAVAGAVESERATELRKERKRVTALRKDAERYAITNVVVPTRTIEKPTDSELYLKEQFEYQNSLMLKEVTKVCPTCGAERSERDLRHAQNVRDNAKTFCDLHRDEYIRIQEKKVAYEIEDETIRTAQTLVDAATKARRDIIEYDRQLADIENELRIEDETLLSADLPEHVKIITEQTFKTGRTQSTCTLTYKGVPLKSINRGQRIRICVELLQYACERNGLVCPIMVDNAESVQGLNEYENVVQFIVA